MKTKLFLLAGLITAGIILFQGCQKQTDSPSRPDEGQTVALTERSSALVEKIVSFRQQVEKTKQYPELKSGEKLSAEEARWNIETLFNVTYGFPDENYSKAITDTTTVYLPVDVNGDADLEDIVAVYEEIIDLVSHFYFSYNFEQKGFLVLHLKTGDIVNGQQEIKVQAVTGNRSEDPDPPQMWKPFDEDDNWWYGEKRGDCNWNFENTDAATEIQYYLNAKKHVPAPPPEGYRYIYINDPDEIELFGDEYKEDGNNLIFCIEKENGNFTDEEMCLNFQELNFHYLGQKKVIYSKIPAEVNKPDNWVFMSCVLTGLMSANQFDVPCIHHGNILTYAYRYIVPIGDISTAVEMEPPVN